MEADNRMETESLTSTSSSDSREIRGYHVKTGHFERKRVDRSDKSDDQLRSVLTGLQKILRRSEPTFSQQTHLFTTKTGLQWLLRVWRS